MQSLTGMWALFSHLEQYLYAHSQTLCEDIPVDCWIFLPQTATDC